MIYVRKTMKMDRDIVDRYINVVMKMERIIIAFNILRILSLNEGRF